VVAQVLGRQPLQLPVLLDADTGPFLVDEVRQKGKFLSFPDLVVFPVIRELVAGLLPHHALLDPGGAAAVFLPVGPSPGEGQLRIGDLLQAFVTDPGQPLLERLGFPAGDGLDDP